MYDLPKNDEISQDLCASLDAADPLAPWRDEFVLPQGITYLDGMSLGALPKAASKKVADVVDHQWGQGLIRSWNTAGWIDAPQRLAAKVAPLIGADADEVVMADSTSVNLFKLLVAALRLRPNRRVILTESNNFPTNIYVASGIERMHGDIEVKLVPQGNFDEALNEDVAVVLLTHVDYKSSQMHDMSNVTRRAHECGALVLWDLSHTAGAMCIDLQGSAADLAVGCGYKYLNGGPGAPAYLFVARHHHGEIDQPITAWMGHARPFDFAIDYAPAQGITQFLSGTPSIVALAAMEASLDIWSQIDLPMIRAKSTAMSELFIRSVEHQLAPSAIQLASPRDETQRGSHVGLCHPQAYAVMQAMIDRGVIGDFREPNLMRFGFAPLYTSFVDAWCAATALVDVIESRAWDQPRFRQRAAVT
ncbi:MAG TPA: kynureninase [Planctomycetes bacterium]|nr:kynureninase [Planctomycetota bacterium]